MASEPLSSEEEDVARGTGVQPYIDLSQHVIWVQFAELRYDTMYLRALKI